MISWKYVKIYACWYISNLYILESKSQKPCMDHIYSFIHSFAIPLFIYFPFFTVIFLWMDKMMDEQMIH